MRPIVTAIVVAHNGARWLNELVDGLRGQRRAPDRVAVVDTGSTDGSAEVLAEAFGRAAVLSVSARTGFGAAVAHALHALPPAQPGEWLWLLHDDCAPAPEALAALLDLATHDPSIAVLGPKLREWPHGRRLQEFGVTIAHSGNRETGLEFGEYDQGQHDAVRDVLAVSTAGMLVRRDVYELLGGFDEHFGLFRDDVDFGWRAVRAGHRVVTCPGAVVFHAEAGYRGYRPLHAVTGRPRKTDRRNAIYTLLVNTTLWMLPLIAVRLAVGSLLRVLALLVVKWPDAAYDELRAVAAAFSRPDRIVVGRRRRARLRRVPHKAVRRLLPPPWIGIQHAVDALSAVVSARTGTHAGSSRRTRRPVETGPVAEEAEELTSEGSGLWRLLLRRPPVLGILALVVLTVVAARGLFGGGALAGGALLPAPDSVVDLWRRYVEPWHPVELGSGRDSSPYVAVVAALGTVLAGKAWLAVDVLVLGAVPLAGLTCFVLMRGIVRGSWVRLWGALTYAMLPALTGAISGGRLGTCVAIVVLPLLALAVVRMIGAGRPGVGSWGAASTAGLLLAILTAFVPLGYVAALVLAVVGLAGPWSRHPGSGRRAVLVLAIPPILLLPWLPTLVQNPRTLLGEAGLAAEGLAADRLAPTTLLFGSPGGPGAAPAWLTGLLMVAALAALFRRDQARGVLAAWTVSIAGLALGLVQSRLSFDTDWVALPVPSWPGLAAVLVVLGWIVAAALAADGAGEVFSQHSFTWRQPLAGLLVLVALATPAVAATWWVIRGAGGPLERTAGPVVPPYVRDAQQSGAPVRALVLRADAGTVRYSVLRADTARLGDAEVVADARTRDRLDTLVGDLLSDAHHESFAAELAAYGIGYVYLPEPADPRSSERLDTTPGLSRASAPEGAAAWQVNQPVSVLRIVGPGSDVRPLDSDGTLGARETRVSVRLPDGPPGRRLVLAESYDPSWRATLDGRPLRADRHAGWAQAFELPATGGRLVVEATPTLHTELLTVQAIAFVVLVVLALPTRVRRDPVDLGGGHARRSSGGSPRPDAPGGRRSAAAPPPVNIPTGPRQPAGTRPSVEVGARRREGVHQ